MACFKQLLLPGPEHGLGEIVLLQDALLDNDLCIVIRWKGEILLNGKSPLGLKLAAAFSEFGRIDHNVWRTGTKIDLERPGGRPRVRSAGVKKDQGKAVQDRRA